MLLTQGELKDLDKLLTSGLVQRNSLELDLYQYYTDRLREENSGDEGLFESLSERLKDFRLMEDMRYLMQRVLRELDKRLHLRTEVELLQDILVDLDIFPSRGQRCGWVEPGLSSRQVWWTPIGRE